MKPRTELSIQFYQLMLDHGYPEHLCELVTKNLNTDYTAVRMIGYLSHYSHLPDLDVADEVLAILSDRNRIMQKKDLEEVNARWNQFLYERFEKEGKTYETEEYIDRSKRY